MNNKDKIQDLLDRVENYRYAKLTVKSEAKSRLTPKEQEEDRIALESLINQISKYNQNIIRSKRYVKNSKWRHNRSSKRI